MILNLKFKTIITILWMHVELKDYLSPRLWSTKIWYDDNNDSICNKAAVMKR